MVRDTLAQGGDTYVTTGWSHMFWKVTKMRGEGGIMEVRMFKGYFGGEEV